jgi:putative phosphoribosyl transferase
MMYHDRADAGRRLAEALGTPSGSPIVLGLPRGGVVVAAAVAGRLGLELDVIVVRKIGVPAQPELAMGALGEDGVLVVHDEVLRVGRVGPEAFDAVRRAEEAELDRRVRAYRMRRPRVPLFGRSVIVVDDGVATGSTAQAACLVARAAGAAHVTLAVPVGPPDLVQRFATVVDQVVCPTTPASLFAIGEAYEDFSPTSDEEVIGHLARSNADRPQ